MTKRSLKKPMMALRSKKPAIIKDGVITLSYNITPFCESGVGSTNSRWEEWRDQFVAYLDLKGVRDTDEKHKALLCFGGPDVRKIAKDVVASDSLMDNQYRATLEALDNYYSPRMSLRYERFKFRQMTFSPNEKVDQFVVRLKTQAAVCSFGEQLDSMIMDQLVFATQTDDKLRAKYLECDTTLDEMLQIGRTYETVNQQVQEIRLKSSDNVDINAVVKAERDSIGKKLSCARCLGNHTSIDPLCPARGSRCNRCNKLGHYARCCRGVKKPFQQQPKSFAGRNVKSIDHRSRGIHTESKPKFVREVDDVTKSVEIRELFHLNGKRTAIAAVGGVHLRFIIDTGADEDVLSMDDWNTLKRVGFEAYEIRKGSDKIFQAYGSRKPLTVLGEVDAMISVEDQACRTTFFVIQDGKHSLLSGRSAERLGVVKFLRSLSNETFPSIKDMCASIKIDKSIPPVRQSYRRIPIPLEEITILKLKELECQDIIERVNEASEWVSPMLVKRKSSNEVRIIIDLREANKAIVREVHPLPTMEQMTARLRGSKFFAKFDIKQAFHQLMLREDCRYITTFISPLGKELIIKSYQAMLIKKEKSLIGLMRYKRLVFGLSAAPELFQKCMETILGGLPWLIVFIDDILIHAPDEKTLAIRITLVKNRLKERDVILNDAKTVECANEIEFLGFHLSADGVKVSPEKLEAIRKFRQPKSAEEIRSFLGLVTFVSRHIPHFSSLSSPLNSLTRKGVPFEWTDVHQDAFNQLKDFLSKSDTLAFFDPELETFVETDASPVGLGAVLYQKTRNGTFNIICYASKTLSDVERRYAQTEREALALVWAPEKFHYYLYGMSFWIITDHKPLVSIFGDRSKPSARIERWKLRLMSYNYQVLYRPGKSNIADSLSRLCQDRESSDRSYDEECERVIRLVSTDICPIAISLDEIIEATKHDVELTELVQWMPYPPRRWPKTLVRYKPIANDLSTDGHIVLKNKKIIVPRSLQLKVLNLGHEPHLGSSAMKKRLREKVWWVRIDTMVEKYVSSCNGCLLVSEPITEPMVRSPLPDGPWKKLALDFTEVTKGVHLLVVVDYFSRYPEIEILTSTTAKTTIFKLRTIFARFGYPDELVCDNGPPFASDEFAEFCKTFGITLKHSIPYAPFQNGLVERHNRTLLKTVKISVAMGRDWKNYLYDFLLAYRNTPHTVTKLTPAKLLLGRNLKDKVPDILINGRQEVNIAVADADKKEKEKGKLYGDQKRKAKCSTVDIGDHVVVKNVVKRNKLTPTFDPQPHVVLKKSGTRLTLKNLSTGVEFDRHVNHVKILISSSPFNDLKHEDHLVDDTAEPCTSNKYVSQPEQSTESITSMGNGPIRNRNTRRQRKPEYLKDYLM